MKRFTRLYLKWREMKPSSFIFTTVILNFILSIPIMLLLILFDISENDIGGVEEDKFSFLGLFTFAVVIAPLVETLIGQSLPIRLIQKYSARKPNIIALAVSAIIFSLMHFGYSIWYSLLTLPMGVLLAQAYIIFQERKESSFWVTCAIHSFRNLIAVITISISSP